jgi:hypothetical protein
MDKIQHNIGTYNKSIYTRNYSNSEHLWDEKQQKHDFPAPAPSFPQALKHLKRLIWCALSNRKLARKVCILTLLD